MVNADQKVTLQELAAEGKCDELRAVLQAGTDDPNSSDGGGATPLHAAAARGQVEAFEILLAYGACPDLVDKKGRSAEGLVLEAYRDACDEVGVSPYRKYLDTASEKKIGKEKAAAWRQRRETLSRIRDALSAHELKKTDPLAGLCDRQGRTRLHWAAGEGDSKIVQQCIAAGISVQAEDNNEDTPLLLAVRAGHTEIVKLLADAWPGGVVHGNKKGENAVFCAVLSGDVDLLAEVTRRAVEVAKDSSYPRLTVHGGTKTHVTPLKQAIKDRNIEMVDILIEHDAWVNDAVHLAMDSGNARICRGVLGASSRMKQGFSPGYHDDDQDTDGATYLEHALQRCTAEVIAVVFELRPDLARTVINTRNSIEHARGEYEAAESAGDEATMDRAAGMLQILEESTEFYVEGDKVQQAIGIYESSQKAAQKAARSTTDAVASGPEAGMEF